MLHLIFQSPLESAVLQRIASNDDVVFMENAVFRLYKNNNVSDELLQMLSNKIHLFVLQEELETRGIVQNELLADVKVINYQGLVQLTESNTVIRTWH